MWAQFLKNLNFEQIFSIWYCIYCQMVLLLHYQSITAQNYNKILIPQTIFNQKLTKTYKL